MTKRQLLKALEAIPPDAEITVGKCVVIDEEARLTGILELPVSGFGYDQNTNELHFLLDLEHREESVPSEPDQLAERHSACRTRLSQPNRSRCGR